METSHHSSDRQQPYRCCFNGCKFRYKKHPTYLLHLESLHRNNSNLACYYKHSNKPPCERRFSTLDLLRVHVTKSHRNIKRNIRSQVQLKKTQLAEKIVELRCLNTSCGNQLCTGIEELRKHLYDHTDKNEEVQCLYCNYKTTITSTIKQHLFRKHRHNSIDHLVGGIRFETCVTDNSAKAPSDEISSDVLEHHDFDEYDQDSREDNVSDEDNDELSAGQENELNMDEEQLFIETLAIRFNSWMNVENIAWKNVNKIVSEIFDSYECGVKFTLKKAENILHEEGIGEDTKKRIINRLKESDPFSEAKKVLLDQTKRLSFLKNNFPYVEPEFVSLKTDDEVGTYSYIPIKKTLKNLLEHESYRKQVEEDPYFYQDGLVKDLRDGRFFREDSVFGKDRSMIGLKIFADELEIANPLGAGKGLYKLNMTYYTLVNVQPQLGSTIKEVQLISIVPSITWKKHGNYKCNRRLIEDLKSLEEEGLLIEKPNPSVVTVGLYLFLGDNLGQHNLGEFSSCFSSGHICRWCKITYEDVCKNNHFYDGCPEDFHVEFWSEEEYNRCARLASEDDGADTYGIKGECVFNSLQSFHCVRQLAPCYGHDVLEGVLAKDIQFLLEYVIVKEKLMDVDTFNYRLKHFKLSERDRGNRPKNFKQRKYNSKYEGNAGQLRVLSKIITILLCEELEKSEIGYILVKLQEMVELIVAPMLTHYEIDFHLKVTIFEYIRIRIEAIEKFNMPKIIPKHHMICHYPDIYKELGPLTQLWGLRFESSHTYFKNKIRVAKNFKNPAKTCATRYQLAQISHHYDGLFSIKIQPPENALTKEETVESIDSYLRPFVEKLPNGTLLPVKVNIWGTKYAPGMILVMDKCDFGELTVGVIKSIAVLSKKVLFACETYLCYQSKMNYYVSSKKLDSLKVVDYDDLFDYHPLTRIGTSSSFVFSLHHFISLKD